jgi:hypothetical protein
MLGMPTQSDLDAAFRKIADLERALRSLHDQVADVRHDAQRDVPAAASDAEPVRRPSAAKSPRSAQPAQVKPTSKAGTKKQPSSRKGSPR